MYTIRPTKRKGRPNLRECIVGAAIIVAIAYSVSIQVPVGPKQDVGPNLTTTDFNIRTTCQKMRGGLLARSLGWLLKQNFDGSFGDRYDIHFQDSKDRNPWLAHSISMTYPTARGVSFYIDDIQCDGKTMVVLWHNPDWLMIDVIRLDVTNKRAVRISPPAKGNRLMRRGF